MRAGSRAKVHLACGTGASNRRRQVIEGHIDQMRRQLPEDLWKSNGEGDDKIIMTGQGVNVRRNHRVSKRICRVN